MYASDYIQRVLDFNALSIARSDAGWQIRGADRLRELRIDAAQGYPDLRNSRNVIGYRRNGNDLYIHLGQAEALLVLQSSPPRTSRIWSMPTPSCRAGVTPPAALKLPSKAKWRSNSRWQITQDCRIHADNTLLKPLRVANGISISNWQAMLLPRSELNVNDKSRERLFRGGRCCCSAPRSQPCCCCFPATLAVVAGWPDPPRRPGQ